MASPDQLPERIGCFVWVEDRYRNLQHLCDCRVSHRTMICNWNGFWHNYLVNLPNTSESFDTPEAAREALIRRLTTAKNCQSEKPFQ